jgi:hypothetical protein
MSHASTQRRFIMHSAHTTVGVSAGLSALRKACKNVSAAPRTGPHRLQVRVVLGAMDDGWHDSLAALNGHLRADNGFVRQFALRRLSAEASGDDLEACDCLLMLGRPATTNRRQLEQIEDYCRRGRALVALRCASRAFPMWPGFNREVLGGDYQGQHDVAQVDVRPAPDARRHPVLEGVAPFVSRGSLYENPWLAGDAALLLVGTADDRLEPLAWTRSLHGRRVFYSSLGHAGDFRHASFLRLLDNAVRWVCRTHDEQS